MSKKSKKKRGFPVFYTIYWTLVVLVLIAIGIGCRYLWDYCVDYEAVQPKYAAQEYIDIYEKGDISRMIELSGGGIELYDYENASDYEEYVRSILEGKTITCEPAYSSDKTVKKYKAKADGAVFSEFTLKMSDKKSEHGLDMWEFDSMILDMPAPSTTYTCKVLSNYTVYVNGTALSDEFITEDHIETFAAGMKLPSNVYLPEYRVYTYKCHFGEPQIEVRTADGTTAELFEADETGRSLYMELDYCDETAKPKYEEYVLTALKAYETFISEDGSRANALKYVLPKSNMENYIDNYDDKWFTPHKTYDFADETTWNYYKLADNCFCCNAQMVFTMYTSAGKAARYPITTRLYFLYNSNKKAFQIFDYQMLDFDYDVWEETKAAKAE